MKQLIAPVAIIIALIVFFVIVDRNEFRHNGNVQTVQSEDFTTNRKPSVSLHKTKPVTELKANPGDKEPVDNKPVAETKPVEAKPQSFVTKTESAEAKTLAETDTDKPAGIKREEKGKPQAVTFLTPEEAVMANRFALFLSTMQRTVIEGKITERSHR